MNHPDANTLAEEHARLKQEIAAGREDLRAAAHDVTEPLRRLEHRGEQLKLALHHYGFLLLPVAVLVILKPQATLRLAVRLATSWLTFQRYRHQLSAYQQAR